MTMARSHLVDTSITRLVSLRYPLSPSRLPARRGTCVGAGAAAPLPQGLGVWSWMGSRAGRRRRSAALFRGPDFESGAVCHTRGIGNTLR